MEKIVPPVTASGIQFSFKNLKELFINFPKYSTNRAKAIVWMFVSSNNIQVFPLIKLCFNLWILL